MQVCPYDFMPILFSDEVAIFPTEPKRKKALSSAPKKESKEETKSVTCQAWEFCQDHSRSVEVFYKNMDGDKILTRVHFQSDPEVSTVGGDVGED